MEEKLEKNLKAAWNRYHAKVQGDLCQLISEDKTKGHLRLINPSLQLGSVVDEFEGTPEFKSLVAQVRATFLLDDYHGGEESFWKVGLKNFLRRSRFYNDLSKGVTVSPADMLTQLENTFRRRATQITYLAPMEFIHFGCDSMEFKRFTIKRFKKNELDALLQNSVNEVFYPWASVDAVRLAGYWFIVVTGTEPAHALGKFYSALGDVGKIDIQFTKYPAIEIALQELALIDWEADWVKQKEGKPNEWEQWERFAIPFVMKIEDDLLNFPGHAPDVAKLTTELKIDSATGEELGEYPSVSIYLDEKETAILRSYLDGIDSLLGTLKAHKTSWPFLERALGFLVKAFFTYDLEQLLWHIAALEAALGEDREGITDRLARRIGSILGETESQQQAIRKQFKQLYAFRSDLVHGDEFEKQIWEGHLRDGRNLARRVLLWFLHLIANIHDHTTESEYPAELPKREELLILIDMDPSARMRLMKLHSAVPAQFPYVAEWVE
jgi:hypothetical protein